MEEKEIMEPPAAGQADENVVQEEPAVQAAEEPAAAAESRTFTQEEVDALMGKRLARERVRLQKEYQRKYGPLEQVLVAGTGKSDLGEITEDFRRYYAQKGVPLPQQEGLSGRDLALLAKAEAQELIQAGPDEVAGEVERLAAIGPEKMTGREKALFQLLAQHRQAARNEEALEKLGVTQQERRSPAFADFAAKFRSDIPIEEVYRLYQTTQPKKQTQTMGSMKNTTSGDSGVKDFYTREEALKFSKQDFDKNPALFRAVEKSMQKW